MRVRCPAHSTDGAEMYWFFGPETGSVRFGGGGGDRGLAMSDASRLTRAAGSVLARALAGVPTGGFTEMVSESPLETLPRPPLGLSGSFSAPRRVAMDEVAMCRPLACFRMADST